MRQVILDTETTGLDWASGHRVIEVGCIEMIDRQTTTNHFHHYFNPEREIDAGALRVHGLSQDFLKTKPTFKTQLQNLINFIDGAEIIIHNAAFDVGFLNNEFTLAGYKKNIEHHCTIIDTLTMARKLHPGQKNNLDALCKRYNVNNSHRNLHGALLDAEILAHVYLAMTGGQTSLFEELKPTLKENLAVQALSNHNQNHSLPIIHATEDELLAHNQFMETIKT